jgi:uncharacterized delta-60 repeat protein
MKVKPANYSMRIQILILINLFGLALSVCSQVPGDLDSLFGVNGKIALSLGTGSDYGWNICIQDDGKILVGGSSQGDFALIRLENNGSMDLSFGQDGIVKTEVGTAATMTSLIIQPDEKIIGVGYAKINGSHHGFVLVRYNSNGSLDGSFGINGIVKSIIGNTEAIGRSAAIQADGKILVTGEAGGWPSDFETIRYNPDGTPDNSFGIGGVVITDLGNGLDLPKDIAIQNDNKIIVVGHVEPDMGIVRYNPNGTLDSLFGTGGKVITELGLTSEHSAVLVSEDNKIITVGHYSNGGSYRLAITCYNPDGTLDSLFGDGGITIVHSGYSDYASEVLLQQNDHMVVSGTSYVGAFSYFELVCFNEFGIVDSTFGDDGIVHTTFNQYDRCNGMAVQEDGKIVAAGYTYNGEYMFAVSRYIGDLSIFTNDFEVKSINIYPNPVDGTINIEVPELMINTHITIFNGNGQILMERSIHDLKTQMDLSTLKNGIYFIKLNNDKYIGFQKIIKM